MGRLGDGRKTAMGYLIFDRDGRAQLHTLRSNRGSAWAALSNNYATLSPKARRRKREQWQGMGFICHFVIVQQSSINS